MGAPNSNKEGLPNEARQDPIERRAVLIRTDTFVTFQKRVEAILGLDTSALLYEAGITAGRTSVTTQLQKWPERDMEFLQKWSESESSQEFGWFKSVDLDLDLITGKGFARIGQSFIAEAYGKSKKTVCDFLSGFFTGILEEIGERKPITGEEISCVAKGDPVCTFKFEPSELDPGWAERPEKKVSMHDSSSDREGGPKDGKRDPSGIRQVFIRAETFVNFQKRVEAILGSDTSALLYEAGLSSGRTSANTFLQKWPERGMEFLKKWYEAGLSTGRTPVEAPLQIWTEQDVEFLKKRTDYDIGFIWFKLDEMTLDLNQGRGSIQITQSFIGESYGKSDKPVCDFLAGFLIGVIEEVVGKPLTGEEITCIAKGDPVCTFKFEPVEE